MMILHGMMISGAAPREAGSHLRKLPAKGAKCKKSDLNMNSTKKK